MKHEVVSLHGGCERVGPACRRIVQDEYRLLNFPMYREGVAAARVESAEGWVATYRTARKRALKADRLGYSVSVFEPADWNDDILRINRSAPERQGRKMSSSYTERPPTTGRIGPPRCPLHHVLMYGVFKDDALEGYANMIRCGELLHVSQFLGCADHLDDGIMYLLVREILFHELVDPPVVLYYNRWDSGTDGLRFFKERVGLQETEIEWKLTT